MFIYLEYLWVKRYMRDDMYFKKCYFAGLRISSCATLNITESSTILKISFWNLVWSFDCYSCQTQQLALLYCTRIRLIYLRGTPLHSRNWTVSLWSLESLRKVYKPEIERRLPFNWLYNNNPQCADLDEILSDSPPLL